MNIEITIGGPLADAINNLAAALQTAGLIERSAAPKAPKKKAQPEVAQDNAGSSGSDQTQDRSSPVAEVGAPLSTPTEPVATTTQSEATAPITHESAKTLAAVKAKKVGPAVVKGVIADTGFAQIADIDKHEVLVSLYKNLEAL
jgi:hypothetical protein